MTFKSKISVILATTLLIGLVGCSKEVNYEEVKANTPKLIHEDLNKEIQNMTDKNNILGYYFLAEAKLGDSKKKVQEYESKLTEEEKTKIRKYAELYTLSRIGISDKEVKKNITNDFKNDVEDYLNEEYLSKDTDLQLTEQFAEMKPIETMQKYLKENDISIKSVKLDDDFIPNFRYFPFVVPVTYTIEGKAGNKDFKDTIKQNFYYSPEDDEVLTKKPLDVEFRIDGVK